MSIFLEGRHRVHTKNHCMQAAFPNATHALSGSWCKKIRVECANIGMRTYCAKRKTKQKGSGERGKRKKDSYKNTPQTPMNIMCVEIMCSLVTSLSINIVSSFSWLHFLLFSRVLFLPSRCFSRQAGMVISSVFRITLVCDGRMWNVVGESVWFNMSSFLSPPAHLWFRDNLSPIFFFSFSTYISSLYSPLFSLSHTFPLIFTLDKKTQINNNEGWVLPLDG